MQKKLEENEFNERFVFSDEATFHTNGKVSRHNVRIWGKENPHATIEHEKDSPEVSEFCAISKNHVHGPFFFEGNVTGDVYLQLLQMNMKISFVNKTVLHLTKSSLCGLISLTICQGDGLGVLAVTTI